MAPFSAGGEIPAAEEWNPGSKAKKELIKKE